MNDNLPEPAPKRKYNKTPAPLAIPTLESIRARGTGSSSNTPITPEPSSASTQASLRPAKRNNFQKMNDVLATWGFHSIGDFLATLFHARVRGEKDHRSKQHRQAVAAFLQGRTKIVMADIIPLIYNHHKSRPKKANIAERAAAFSPYTALSDIRCAAPCLSAWATRIVGNAAYFRVGKMARKPKDGSRSRRHLRASTNGRTANTHVVEWEDIEFTMEELARQYKDEDGFLWWLTECMAGSRKKGNVVVKKTRPHPVIQVGAISSFITARNQYASGDLALSIGVWLFATQAHIDVKRVMCRFRYSVSDSTARRAVNTLTDSGFEALRAQVRNATQRSEVEWGKISDNIQRYDGVYEHGIGRENELKVGIACTAFRFHNCKPGAFHAEDHIKRVIQNDRKDMTTESVMASIDWEHNDSITELHYARVLVEFIPHLNHLAAEISTRFRTTLAIHRLAPHKTILQPLGTNAERQIENQGYQKGFLDFDQQMGIEPEKSDNLLSWSRGDGAAHATHMRLQRILATTPNIYKSFRNAISTPEIWHTKATKLNSTASNHYGPAASPDPSSLSRSSNAANMKRPSDLKKCDFYPTSRSMTLIWEARVLDCWRLILECDADLLQKFDRLVAQDALPTLDELLVHARVLRLRYATQAAYERSLDKSEHDEAAPSEQFPHGAAWTAPYVADTLSAHDSPAEPSTATKKPAAGPQTHTEPDGFNGDRVLSNAILFLREFGWWIEMNYAIPEGDVGRLLQIMKINIFTFAGTANQNYVGYMLDLYSLLQFESSPDLRDGLLDNLLFNLEGGAGDFVEGDITQEWFNRWLEEIAGRRGGDFDEQFYRKTVSPNVLHFLKMKKDMESAFALKRRGKAHTSPHLRDETQVLLRMYKEEELHRFRSGRSMGHAAVNCFDRGYERLDGGKMKDYVERSTEYATLLREMELLRSAQSDMTNPEASSRNISPDLRSQSASPTPPPSNYQSRTASPDIASMTSNNFPIPSQTSRATSPSSARSSGSNAARIAADCVEEWDQTDHSDEPLFSGSDLAVSVDPETGRMSLDWYEPEEFELLLENMFGPEIDQEESEDDQESEVEDSDSESEGE
ncbi:hypothetical protein C8F04DRAFT_979773 [Mycena alexandri]|uniref:DUF6589 domain-containing protein n=1 Tax=Mycena alexandri TaxID=1745969 RepID=A0AAD6RXK4_9AGAR|nr:hypothetical protein C8F04DRAFT_979773 [Mycena alexandri]